MPKTSRYKMAKKMKNTAHRPTRLMIAGKLALIKQKKKNQSHVLKQQA